MERDPTLSSPKLFLQPINLIIFAVAVLGWFWTDSLYKNPAQFPRESSAFPKPAKLEKIQSRALSRLKDHPDDPSAWMTLTEAYFQRGPDRYLEGLEAMEKARELGTLDPRLFYYAGVMYEAKGLLDFARPDYERFLRHFPRDGEVRVRLGNLCYRTNDLECSARQFARVLESSPGDAVVSFNLAMVYRDLERWGEGLTLLKRFVDKGWTLPAGGDILLGDIYRGLEEYGRALEHYNASLSSHKNDPKLMEALALTHEGLGNIPDAIDHWKRLRDLDPKNRLARRKLRALRRKRPAS